MAVNSSDQAPSPADQPDPPEGSTPPPFDMELVGTDRLVTELLDRSRAAVICFVPKSVEGEDYANILMHVGMGWEVKGLAEHARDVMKKRFMGNYAADEDD